LATGPLLNDAEFLALHVSPLCGCGCRCLSYGLGCLVGGVTLHRGYLHLRVSSPTGRTSRS
jgi:hypothetical protein